MTTTAAARFDKIASNFATSEVHSSSPTMARLTHPGGVVAVIALEGHPDPSIDAFNHHLELVHDPTHVRSYTSVRWRELLEGAGLRIEVLESEQRESPAGVPIKRWCEIAG